MPASDLEQELARQEEHSRIRQQIAFASGLFQGDITIRTLLESLAEGVVIIDKSGTILLVNSYAEHIFGYPEKELIGQAHAVLVPERLRNVHQEHQAHFFAEPRTRPMGQFLDLVGRRKDGSEFPVEICLSFIETVNGVLVMAFISDITLRKRAEDEILRLNVELSARAAELEASNRKLETANQELEAFNYTVAHDLRQPLNLLALYCQTIDALCGDQFKGDCAGYVQKTYKATVQMNSLINALFNFSHSGQVDLRREKVDLSALVHGVVEGLAPTASERHVEFQIADGVVAYADSDLVRVVLDNLLGNAWKYTGSRERAIIEFGEMEVDGRAIYFVRDNGAGFHMVDADKLFTPFQRLPGAEEFKGFGIGLATVGRIILRHGGKVWAESEIDKVTTIYFTLSADEISN